MMKLIKIFLAIAAVFFCVTEAAAQGNVAVKTNILYGAGTYTPNLGLEIGLAPRSSLSLSGSYNPWNLKGSQDGNKKLVHWLGNAEYRYWFCERFNGHFIGGHLFGGMYNISGRKIPLLLENGSDKYRYKGEIYGVGISYGYQLMLSKHWNLEFSAGIGYGRMRYDKYECMKCGRPTELNVSKNYFGPTKLGISLVYIIK